MVIIREAFLSDLPPIGHVIVGPIMIPPWWVESIPIFTNAMQCNDKQGLVFTLHLQKSARKLFLEQ